MNILITGAAGFVGKNLTAALRNLQNGKDRTRPGLTIGEIYEYCKNTSPALLTDYCKKADYVFNLAGVNRTDSLEDFMTGNADFSSLLLDSLKKCGNPCPVMLASSAQASLVGRYAGSAYGKSKLAAEKLFFEHAAQTGAQVMVYRFPNVFGKWCRPNYKQLELYSYRVPRLVRDSSICLDGYYYARCPRCQSSLGRDYQLYCDRCGQALDWSKWAEEY